MRLRNGSSNNDVKKGGATAARATTAAARATAMAVAATAVTAAATAARGKQQGWR
ncbi:conserved hypothetical protein [Ricinus communis]|uniref:Uncharacterized protein n=1 Tax=Ricinus communis TaxID=3988 RepID=B9S850_RICCO|nr:conserved hypothetical protein [Ricinus communis]